MHRPAGAARGNSAAVAALALAVLCATVAFWGESRADSLLRQISSSERQPGGLHAAAQPRGGTPEFDVATIAGLEIGEMGAQFPGPVVMRALSWARLRILAFRHAVMTSRDGKARGSIFPLHTQEEPYEQQVELSGDHALLAEHGLLLTPHYLFSAAYNVTLDPVLARWVALAARRAAWCRGQSSGAACMTRPPVVKRQRSTPPHESNSTSPWESKAGIRRWGVRVPTRLARHVNESFDALLAQPEEDVEIDPEAHARTVAPCVLEHMYTNIYFHDLDNLHASIVRENRYPPLNDVMRGSDMHAVGRAVFRSVEKQPLPQVLTAFNVVVGETGYIFAKHDGQGNGGVNRINLDRYPGSYESFRPIQCLYREFDHARGKDMDAHYSNPVGPVHEEVIVLSQYWGQQMYHLYEEDFIRLAYMLDYAHAHPQVKLHVKLHDFTDGPRTWITALLQALGVQPPRVPHPDSGGPHAWLRELMLALGIDPSRAVWGAVAARIVHIPDGTPCGEPYAFSQVALREALRRALHMRPVLDVWGDGRSVAYGFGRGTISATAEISRSSGLYLSRVHTCMVSRYAATSFFGRWSNSGAGRVHPLARLATQAAAVLAAAEATKEAAVKRPKVVLVQRLGSRHVPNFDELRDALATLPGVDLLVFGASQPGTQADHLVVFSSADVIVGPHGAGFTNAITSWPGT